jgi:hypothetical protein
LERRNDRQHGPGKLGGSAHLHLTPCRRCLTGISWIAQLPATLFSTSKRGTSSLRNLTALLLRQCRIEMQHERICVGAKLCDDERHALRHQPGNEGYVARKTIELGNQDRALLLAGSGQRCGELRPSIEGVCTFARFDLGESPASVMPSASAKRATAVRCASRPRPDRP